MVKEPQDPIHWLQWMETHSCESSMDDLQIAVSQSPAFFRGGGGTHLERGYGDMRPWRPLFTPLLPLARVPFQAKESVHKTPFWENWEILASTASIITQISAHKPPNLEVFSSHPPKFGNFPLTSPPFQRQMSVGKPHTSEIRAAHPYLKKSWVPPPPPGAFLCTVQYTLGYQCTFEMTFRNLGMSYVLTRIFGKCWSGV